MCFQIVFHGAAALDARWLPYTATTGYEDSNSLGILALVCADGAVRVFSVPHPKVGFVKSFLDKRAQQSLPPLLRLRHWMWRDPDVCRISCLNWSTHRRQCLLLAAGSGGIVLMFSLSAFEGLSSAFDLDKLGVDLVVPLEPDMLLRTELPHAIPSKTTNNSDSVIDNTPTNREIIRCIACRANCLVTSSFLGQITVRDMRKPEIITHQTNVEATVYEITFDALNATNLFVASFAGVRVLDVATSKASFASQEIFSETQGLSDVPATSICVNRFGNTSVYSASFANGVVMWTAAAVST